MDPSDPPLQLSGFGWKLGATAFFVAANGFFVAAEFALVKVRATQLHALAEAGSHRARAAQHIHHHLDHYLSACQLGITLASLILGWLAEPAVADLLLVGIARAGFEVSPHAPALHAAALAIALAVITTLHMTVGEQAPKIWAIHRAESTALLTAYPLRTFATVFGPFIWAINAISNGMLRTVGLSRNEDSSHSLEEIKGILAASARAGHLSRRQLELTENVFRIVGLEVRHVMVPRVDVAYLSLEHPLDENLRVVRESGHSRFPLCRVGLDTVVGFVHAKEVLGMLADDKTPDLEVLARKPQFVADTQPLSGLIVRMQATAAHCAVVVDEHGTAVGLAFLEDALEEIVGPLRDEFDESTLQAVDRGGGVLEVDGSMALPEAVDLLDLPELGDEADTIGGYVIATLGRLPRSGDQLEVGKYRVTVMQVARQRVRRLRLEPMEHPVRNATPADV